MNRQDENKIRKARELGFKPIIKTIRYLGPEGKTSTLVELEGFRQMTPYEKECDFYNELNQRGRYNQ